MRCIRILTLLSLILGLLGCRDEVESSTYPMVRVERPALPTRALIATHQKWLVPSFPDGRWIVAG